MYTFSTHNHMCLHNFNLKQTKLTTHVSSFEQNIASSKHQDGHRGRHTREGGFTSNQFRSDPHDHPHHITQDGMFIDSIPPLLFEFMLYFGFY
jgi:hypothetical protein